jgi:toxin ParE1/3/4
LKISWSEAASRDLDNIETYIFADNPRAAIETVLKIISKVDTLLPDNLAIGRAGRIFGTRELVLSDLPYVVMYQARANTIEIIRVLHAARKWPDAL